MSTGAELLRTLKERQQQKHQQSNQSSPELRRSSTEHIIEECQPLTVDAPIKSNTAHKVEDSITIEVCLGPECSHSGGGAAFLEIEELVSGKDHSVDLVAGGCRDFCTVGPNVHVKCGNCDAHYTKVNGPAACREAVALVIGPADSSYNDMNSNANLLKMRQDGRRWRSHRERSARERRLRVRERNIQPESTCDS
jgi:hypothetical protein